MGWALWLKPQCGACQWRRGYLGQHCSLKLKCCKHAVFRFHFPAYISLYTGRSFLEYIKVRIVQVSTSTRLSNKLFAHPPISIMKTPTVPKERHFSAVGHAMWQRAKATIRLI